MPAAIRIEIVLVQIAAGGRGASRNCQIKNEARFILNETSFPLQYKRDQNAQGSFQYHICLSLAIPL